jgi:signal transduction histidine kinase
MAERERGSPPSRETSTRTLVAWLAGAALLALGTLLWTWTAGRGAGLGPPDALPPRMGGAYPRIPGSPARAVGVLRGFGVGALTWYACLVAAPLLVWLSRRVPLGRVRRARAVAVHAAALATLVVATSVAQHRLTYAGAPRGGPPLATFLAVALLFNGIPLLAVAALVHALEAWRRARESELDAARLGMQLAQARLDALTARLEPHFLFNALQGVSTLIHRDPAAADAMLGRVSDLLREVLHHEGRSEVPLDEELRVLDGYLEVARQRLGDRLDVTVDVAPSARGALVPFFVLQPLVENAVHHGVAARAAGGRVWIRAARDGDRLRLEVCDDGPGLDRRELPRGRRRVGVANTRERLEQLYGDRHRFALAPRDAGGVCATVEIPFREAPPDDARARLSPGEDPRADDALAGHARAAGRSP